MNYTIHQLKVFLKVVEHQSITKAAEDLYMTQPAVSIQLKNFQDQFPIPLTEVIGRQLYVTDFGKEIALLSENVLNQINAIQYKTSEYEGILTGKLKISSASTGKYVMPYFISQFMDSNKGIELKLDVTNKSRVIESLKNNEIDFALVSIPPDNLEFEEEILVDNSLFLIGNIAKRDKNRPLIYREEGSATRQEMELYFKDKLTKSQQRLELTSNEAVKQAVLAGLGYSILPLIGLRNELKEGLLHILPSKGLPIVTQWRLIWLKNKKLSPVASAYLDFIRNNKRSILSKNFGWLSEFD